MTCTLVKGDGGLTPRTEVYCMSKNLKALGFLDRELQVNLKIGLLLSKCVLVLTAWNKVAEKGNKEILEELCVWGREVRVKTRGDLLLPNGRKGVTAWDIAALNDIKEGLQKLYCWGKEVQVNFKM